MAQFDYDVGVIGGGAAGLTVASGAAQLGAKTLLVEREKLLGGDCLHYGCVPSKTLIRSAHVYHQLKRAKEYGLPEIKPGPVDFSLIADRIQNVIAGIQHHDSVERFNGLGVEVRFGDPRFSDDHAIVLDAKPITARSWVIATGSSAAVPELPGLSQTPFITNREIFSLDVLPPSLVILGAGPIAIEMAQAFCRLGSKVTVLQRSGQILGKEDKDLADEVMSAMERDGVKFHLNVKVLSVRETEAGKEVLFKTAEGAESSVTGTHLLVALGRSVNTAGLDLEKAGIDYERRGISVDNRLRTSQKHIFAAGDVIGGYQFTHAAGYEGGIVVANAVLHVPRRTSYTWMPWCTYTAPELASIGFNEKRAREAGIDYSVHEEQFHDNDRAQAENEPMGKIKLLVGKGGKPIGVQILGHHGGELLSEWVAVLNGGTRLATLAGSIHPYPTLAEINKRVVGSIMSEKLFSPKVKKILKMVFRYRGG